MTESTECAPSKKGMQQNLSFVQKDYQGSTLAKDLIDLDLETIAITINIFLTNTFEFKCK